MSRRAEEIWGKETIARFELEDAASAAHHIRLQFDEIEAELTFYEPGGRAAKQTPEELIADSRAGLQAMAEANPETFQLDDEPGFGGTLTERSGLRVRIEQGGRLYRLVLVAGRIAGGAVLRVSGRGPEAAARAWQDFVRVVEFASGSAVVPPESMGWIAYVVYGYRVMLPERVDPPMRREFDLIARPPCWGVKCGVRLLNPPEAAAALDDDAAQAVHALRELMLEGSTLVALPERRLASGERSVVMRSRAFLPPVDEEVGASESGSDRVWLQWYALVRFADGWGVAFELRGDTDRASYSERVLRDYEDWLLRVESTVSLRSRGEKER